MSYPGYSSIFNNNINNTFRHNIIKVLVQTYVRVAMTQWKLKEETRQGPTLPVVTDYF